MVSSRHNASRDSASVAAVTDDDFPRVLNGPAPGYAEDALRRLLFGAPPSEEVREIPVEGGERGMTIELVSQQQQQQQRAEENVGWRQEGSSRGWRTAEEQLSGYGGGGVGATAWNNLSSCSDEGMGREVRDKGGGNDTYELGMNGGRCCGKCVYIPLTA